MNNFLSYQKKVIKLLLSNMEKMKLQEKLKQVLVSMVDKVQEVTTLSSVFWVIMSKSLDLLEEIKVFLLKNGSESLMKISRTTLTNQASICQEEPAIESEHKPIFNKPKPHAKLWTSMDWSWSELLTLLLMALFLLTSSLNVESRLKSTAFPALLITTSSTRTSKFLQDSPLLLTLIQL